MADLLLPAPASINSQECDCKWVRRSMGGSVIQLDISRDTVSIVCNIKSTRGHTSINLTPWESRAQYKKWNKETYKPHDQASHVIDRFHAAEKKSKIHLAEPVSCGLCWLDVPTLKWPPP